MSGARAAIERRIAIALEASPARIPVLLGGTGSGRTSIIARLHAELGREASQYVDLERAATTPERFAHALVQHSPFVGAATNGDVIAGTRAAFDRALVFLKTARRSDGGPATFLLDEVLDVRTFESFPGLKTVLQDLLQGVASCENRFVLSSRFTSRALRVLHGGNPRFEVVHVTPLSTAELRETLARACDGWTSDDLDELARMTGALVDGRPAYVRALARAMRDMRSDGGGDPISALAAEMTPEGELYARCRFCYELRLQQARGYGALKAILEILADEEPLNLTEISRRLHRTPGSAKDYLGWLEDVDLVTVRQKRYTFSDPVLRLWVRLHCRATPPSDEQIAREVQSYALARLPIPAPPARPAPPMSTNMAESVGALTPVGARRSSGIIEID